MEQDEAQFNKIFQPLRSVTPRTSLLTEILERMPKTGPVTAAPDRRFSFMDLSRYGVVAVFAALVLFFSPLLHPVDPIDEVYAMELDVEEFGYILDDEEFAVEIDYLSEQVDLAVEDVNN